MQRKPNKYRETEKVILRASGVRNGLRQLYFESKEDKELIKTHEIRNGKISFLISKSRGQLKRITIEGKFNPFSIETINDVKTATGNLCHPFGGGFDNKSLRYFISDHLDYIKTITISDAPTKFQGNGQIVINKKDIESLIKDLNIQRKANSSQVNAIISNFWSKKAPELKFSSESYNSHKSLILRNLNDKLLGQLTESDVKDFGKFYFKAIKQYKLKKIKQRQALFIAEQSKVLSLQNLIGRYEKLLQENPLEKKWQNFFDDFVTLFDSRYQDKIDLKNITVGFTKYPDLVLLDVYGFIDLYELKRCETKLLKYDNSHKNYYWSDEIAKTIAQTAIYLQDLKENASNYLVKIKDETGIEVKVINPKAFIVAGTSEQLEGDKMMKQFKVLRESLKDVHFILYDELLLQLRNLLKKLEDPNLQDSVATGTETGVSTKSAKKTPPERLSGKSC